MHQADLKRAVAKATGETVRQIARHGFGLLVLPAARVCRQASHQRRRPKQRLGAVPS